MFSLKRTESQRSCSQRSGMQWLPADHPRCRERAGWPATGAAGKPFGDVPSPFPAPHGAGTLGLQAGLGSTATEGAGRGGATSTGKAALHPGLLARQGWPWITQQQELIRALGILPAAPGALLTPGASGTAAKCSLSVLGRYGRMRAE